MDALSFGLFSIAQNDVQYYADSILEECASPPFVCGRFAIFLICALQCFISTAWLMINSLERSVVRHKPCLSRFELCSGDTGLHTALVLSFADFEYSVSAPPESCSAQHRDFSRVVLELQLLITLRVCGKFEIGILSGQIFLRSEIMVTSDAAVIVSLQHSGSESITRYPGSSSIAELHSQSSSNPLLP